MNNLPDPLPAYFTVLNDRKWDEWMYVRMFLRCALALMSLWEACQLAVCLFATCSLLASIVCMFNSNLLWACVRLVNVHSHLQYITCVSA